VLDLRCVAFIEVGFPFTGSSRQHQPEKEIGVERFALPTVVSRVVSIFLAGFMAHAFADNAPVSKPTPPASGATAAEEHFKVEQQTSEGSVSVEGRRIDYQAVAGTLVVHPKGWDDVPQNAEKDKPTPEASMFYVAYFGSKRAFASIRVSRSVDWMPAFRARRWIC
jgi:hypothetical protein